MFTSHYLLLFILLLTIAQYGLGYSIYVWLKGWDPYVPGCDNEKFLVWDTNTECFTHTWDTQFKRDWLWATCSRTRTVDVVYMYGFQSGLETRDCSHPDVREIKDVISDGKFRVPGIKIYALFSDGGSSVPEQRHIPNVAWYNENCSDEGSKIDGVAVNNEDWDLDWSNSQMQAYLDNLLNIKRHADQQVPVGSLKTHFSVGWGWGRKNGEDILLSWNGKVQPVIRHFIDIFDSLEVQAAFVTADAMEERVRIAGWDYALQVGKPMYVNAYINKAYPCQTTFFPFSVNDTDCPAWSHAYKTEAAMFYQLDILQQRMPGLKVCLHHFRGAYASGGYPGWPIYTEKLPSV